MWVAKVESAWENIGRARLYAAVQRKLTGALGFHKGGGGTASLPPGYIPAS